MLFSFQLEVSSYEKLFPALAEESGITADMVSKK
jgi:hypothetical protein